MKKFSTLGLGILLSFASIAAKEPGRLTVSAAGDANIKITVDGSRFDQTSFSNRVVVENLQPGFHAVNVYELASQPIGVPGRRPGDDYRLLYTATVHIRPLFATSIELNPFGGAEVSEQPVPDSYNNRTGINEDRAYHNSIGYHTNGDGPGRLAGYHTSDGYVNSIAEGCTISNEDFFAAGRVMNRENDNGRLLYAKRVVDDNYMTAEQVKELARFFSFDNCRMDFVQYAYRKTIDKNNFRTVCSAFSSGEGRSRLIDFLNGCR